MKKIQMDFAIFTPEVQLQMTKHNIYSKLIVEFGPGGGASVYELLGAEANLKAYIEEVEADGGDAEYFISKMENATL
jgi:hypothetical protein